MTSQTLAVPSCDDETSRVHCAFLGWLRSDEEDGLVSAGVDRTGPPA